MKAIKILFFSFFLLLPILLYSAENYHDPFESLLPKEEKKVDVVPQRKVEPLEVTVQGVLWGGSLPQAIIDNEVYKVGDKLKDSEDTFLLRITDNTVFIVRAGKVYKLTVEEK